MVEPISLSYMERNVKVLSYSLMKEADSASKERDVGMFSGSRIEGIS